MEQTLLDPLNPQGPWAEELIALFKEVVCDAAYQARLERHYSMVKEAVADPSHPAHRRMRLSLRHSPEPLVRTVVPVDGEPYDLGLERPCPCGSGKKYKRCCWKAGACQR